MKTLALMFPKSDTSPKKYTNLVLWKSVKTAKATDAIDSFDHGGLNDEDIISVHPKFPQTHKSSIDPKTIPTTQTLQCDVSRTNGLVGLKTELQGHICKETTATVAQANKLKAKSEVADPSEKKKGKAQKEDGLQEFLTDARWKDLFIPSITHALYVSREPFPDWTTDSKTFLATVQKVFNVSFPNVTYTLSAGDAVTTTAYKCVKSCKSLLASAVLNHIVAFFNAPEYATNRKNILYFVKWVLRHGGPAYFSVPIPSDSIINHKHKDYVPPDGFLKSDFISPIAKQYLNFAKQSGLKPALDAKHASISFTLLDGLADANLIANLVEQAFVAFWTGSYVTPKKFDHKECLSSMKDFLKHLNKVKEDQWRQILQF
ncbi:hypothetical protein CVT25_009052 [Psilocybe cyanescens]|uniref:Uncharacterized protein n=1 Tax=Psilocybe cyanescens TaxID=93625 RepID=A0A409XDQ8_PSICY|nr:hypothetical protein CVT25_009052 [Psilocybe cyanescens]